MQPREERCSVHTTPRTTLESTRQARPRRCDSTRPGERHSRQSRPDGGWDRGRGGRRGATAGGHGPSLWRMNTLQRQVGIDQLRHVLLRVLAEVPEGKAQGTRTLHAFASITSINRPLAQSFHLADGRGHVRSAP